MQIHEFFPRRVFISRLTRPDRRDALMPQLVAAGLNDALWFPAIECGALRNDPRGFLSLSKRSCAIGKRMILRQAGLCKTTSLLFLEDDVVLHPEFISRVESLELPDDWGLFYFGCQHIEPPTWFSPGVVHVRRALDMHAVAIRAGYFLRVRAAMRGRGKGVVGKLHSDLLLSNIHKEIPTYAAYPNLAWQSTSHSDNTGKQFSYYYADGRQKCNRHLLSHLEPVKDQVVYRIRTEGQGSTQAKESIEQLRVIDIPVNYIKQAADVRHCERLYSLAHANAFRLFLDTPARHAIVLEDDTVLVHREWLCLTQFDYFQPFANLVANKPGHRFTIRNEIAKDRPPALIASRRFAESYLRLLAIGASVEELHYLASGGLRVGSYISNSVVRASDLSRPLSLTPSASVSTLAQPLESDHERCNSFSNLKRPVLSVSFCTLCKGRKHHLEVTLSRNLEEVKCRNAEIVLVDWHSDDGLSEWICENFGKEMFAGHLHFYQLQDNLRFSIPVGKNFSHRLAHKEIVVNLDADNYIGDLWYGAQLLAEREFLVCEQYRKGSYGRLAFRREDIERLNGYDESFEPAGHQDKDLIKRATKLGLLKRHWPCHLEALQHPKTETLVFAGGGGENRWLAMERRNALRSARNLRAGLLRTNVSGLTSATFRHNFGTIVSIGADSYFTRMTNPVSD